jgi:rare lipoprotein A
MPTRAAVPTGINRGGRTLNDPNVNSLKARVSRSARVGLSCAVLLGALTTAGFSDAANANNYANGPTGKPSSQQVGRASWYGPGFHGRRTASGQTFNQHGLTAAHRRLPFGSRAKVTNLRNGRTVEVTINDRGPYVGGRIIDLSRAAAKRIAMSGTARVSVTVLP